MITRIIGIVLFILSILGYGAIFLYLAYYERKSNPKDEDKEDKEDDD